jgi:[ribosomal protein S5]-alanine N-acetyltransferase
MIAQVMIGTPRLRIVPFGERHLTADYVGWLNDRELMRFSEQRLRDHTAESCRTYWQSFEGTPHHFVAIERKQGDPAYIGTATVYVDSQFDTANIGILIGDRSAQGQGLGSEVWTGLMYFAFERLGVRKVEAGALAVNERMMRVFEKVGMRRDGQRLRPVLWEGRWVDVVHAAASRTEWAASIPVDIQDGPHTPDP